MIKKCFRTASGFAKVYKIFKKIKLGDIFENLLDLGKARSCSKTFILIIFVLNLNDYYSHPLFHLCLRRRQAQLQRVIK